MMQVMNCKTFRAQCEELNLDQKLGDEALQHLSRCDQCRRFHDEERALRSLMAGLGTVDAPADFDFRLRARMAREREQPIARLHLASLWDGVRPAAAAAFVIAIVVGGILLKGHEPRSGTIAQGPEAPKVANGNLKAASEANDPATPGGNQSLALKPQSPAASQNESPAPKPAPIKRRDISAANVTVTQTPIASQSKERSGVRDFAQMVAPKVDADNLEPVLRVGLSSRPMTFSVDNGRGDRRTISLPAVSFGSSQLLNRSASFVPASAKGEW